MGFIDEEEFRETGTPVRLYDPIRDEPSLDPHSHVDIQVVGEIEG